MFRTECNKLLFCQGHWKLKACFIISNKTVLFCGNSNNWSEVQMKHKIQSDNSIKSENHMCWMCSFAEIVALFSILNGAGTASILPIPFLQLFEIHIYFFSLRSIYFEICLDFPQILRWYIVGVDMSLQRFAAKESFSCFFEISAIMS